MSNDFLVLVLQGLAGGAAVSSIMAALRKLLPKIPRATIPFVLVLISAGADYLTTLVTGSSMSPLMVTLYTTLAVYLREIKTTVQEHGLNG